MKIVKRTLALVLLVSVLLPFFAPLNDARALSASDAQKATADTAVDASNFASIPPDAAKVKMLGATDNPPDASLSTYVSRLHTQEPRNIVFGGIALAILLLTGVLLYFAGRSTAPPRISTLNASFFFWLGIGYTLLLLLLALFYNLTWIAAKPLMFGGFLPVGVPWFGALGAVVISLEGIFAYGQKQWNQKYNYWHIGRPLFGAVLGIVAFFTFLLIVSSSGALPPFLNDPNAITAPKEFIVYYVVAFLVGYREETFRELIRRVTDMILKPVTPSGTTPVVTFKKGGAAISSWDFGKLAANTTSASITIDIENTGNNPLSAPTVALASGSGAEFKIILDQLTNAKELQPGETKSVTVTFQAAVAGSFTDVLIVTGGNLTAPAKLNLAGGA